MDWKIVLAKIFLCLHLVFHMSFATGLNYSLKLLYRQVDDGLERMRTCMLLEL